MITEFKFLDVQYHSFYEHDNNCLDINKYAMYEGATLNM